VRIFEIKSRFVACYHMIKFIRAVQKKVPPVRLFNCCRECVESRVNWTVLTAKRCAIYASVSP
jgi:hypothetical protein